MGYGLGFCERSGAISVVDGQHRASVEVAEPWKSWYFRVGFRVHLTLKLMQVSVHQQ